MAWSEFPTNLFIGALVTGHGKKNFGEVVEQRIKMDMGESKPLYVYNYILTSTTVEVNVGRDHHRVIQLVDLEPEGFIYVEFDW